MNIHEENIYEQGYNSYDIFQNFLKCLSGNSLVIYCKFRNFCEGFYFVKLNFASQK